MSTASKNIKSDDEQFIKVYYKFTRDQKFTLLESAIISLVIGWQKESKNCTQSNANLAEIFNVSKKTISRTITGLNKLEFFQSREHSPKNQFDKYQNSRIITIDEALLKQYQPQSSINAVTISNTTPPVIEIPLEVVSTEYQFNGAESLAIDCDHRHSSSLFNGNEFDNSESVARQQQAEKTTCNLPALLAPLPLTEIPQILTDEEKYDIITEYYLKYSDELKSKSTIKTFCTQLKHYIYFSDRFDCRNPIDMQKQEEIVSYVNEWAQSLWTVIGTTNKAA